MDTFGAELVPLGMDVITWRALTGPLLGILFWWVAGRGIEALLAARRGFVRPEISWVETGIGGALFLFCTIAAIGLPLFGNKNHDPDFPLTLWCCGLGTWALLGAVVAAARVGQWRIRRRSRLPG
jgi:hypothetical protein